MYPKLPRVPRSQYDIPKQFESRWKKEKHYTKGLPNAIQHNNPTPPHSEEALEERNTCFIHDMFQK